MNDIPISFHRGDWLRHPHHGRCRVLRVRDAAVTAFAVDRLDPDKPSEALIDLPLAGMSATPIPRPGDAPIGSPGLYWLRLAHKDLRNVHIPLAHDWRDITVFARRAERVFILLAKAWASEFGDPPHLWQFETPTWIDAVTDVNLFAMLREGHDKARRLCAEAEALSWRKINAAWDEWSPRCTPILVLLRNSIEVATEAICPHLDIFEGDIIEVYRHVGTVHGKKSDYVILDCGRNGVISCSLIRATITRHGPDHRDRIPPPSDPIQHARWLWFMTHHSFLPDWRVCPCCGYPGERTDIDDDLEECVLCGWDEDASTGDEEPSLMNDDMTLSYARRHFATQGHIFPAETKSPALLHAHELPEVRKTKKVILERLDALMQAGSEGELVLTLSEDLDRLRGMILDGRARYTP
ncbi:MAG: CPCC family cysteine-rich protein [Rhodocyclaceae bacterium]|jgi:hypothetical protein|nr:CPCC family cysteine-rich protein [Rhodocyclaceae bacterium]